MICLKRDDKPMLTTSTKLQSHLQRKTSDNCSKSNERRGHRRGEIIFSVLARGKLLNAGYLKMNFSSIIMLITEITKISSFNIIGSTKEDRSKARTWEAFGICRAKLFEKLVADCSHQKIIHNEKTWKPNRGGLEKRLHKWMLCGCGKTNYPWQCSQTWIDSRSQRHLCPRANDVEMSMEIHRWKDLQIQHCLLQRPSFYIEGEVKKLSCLHSIHTWKLKHKFIIKHGKT